MLKDKKSPRRLLYLYDYKGWAIYNVGKLWLEDLPGLEVTFKEVKAFEKNDFSKYDLIWFGYLDLFLYHYSRFYISKENLSKCIITVHDPKELFPECEDWDKIKINLNRWWHTQSLHRWTTLQILKKVKKIVTASKEMQRKLGENGIKSFLIPTTSSLPYRELSELSTKECSLLSVFENYPRKNIELMDSIRSYCNKTLRIGFETKVGKKILSQRRYIKLLEAHSIYVCTSFQEGGPLPAMDAMQRGAVVISTPVGQIQDLINDGENGFICKTREEFIEKITLLAGNLKLLHQMRIKSLENIDQARNVSRIKAAVFQFICSVLVLNKYSNCSKKQKFIEVTNYLPLLTLVSFTNKWSLLSKRIGGRS